MSQSRPFGLLFTTCLSLLVWLTVGAQTPYATLPFNEPEELGYVRDAVGLADGGVVVVGMRGVSGDVVASETVVQRYNAADELVWERTFDDPETEDTPGRVRLTPDGEIAVLIRQNTPFARTSSTVIWRLEADGTERARIRLFQGKNRPFSINEFTTDGSYYYFTGARSLDAERRNFETYFVLDASGNEITSSKTRTGTLGDIAYDVASEKIILVDEDSVLIFDAKSDVYTTVDPCTVCRSRRPGFGFDNYFHDKQLVSVDDAVVFVSPGINDSSVPVLSRIDLTNSSDASRQDIPLDEELAGHLPLYLSSWGTDSLLLRTVNLDTIVAFYTLSSAGQFGRRLDPESALTVDRTRSNSRFIASEPSPFRRLRFLPYNYEAYEISAYPAVLDGISGDTIAKISDARSAIASKADLRQCVSGADGEIYCIDTNSNLDYTSVTITAISPVDGSILSRNAVEVELSDSTTQVRGVTLNLGRSLSGATIIALQYDELAENPAAQRRLVLLDEDLRQIRSFDIPAANSMLYSPLPEGGFLVAQFTYARPINMFWVNELDGIYREVSIPDQELPFGLSNWLVDVNAGASGTYAYTIIQREDFYARMGSATVTLRDGEDELLYEHLETEDPKFYISALAPDGRLVIAGRERIVDTKSTPYLLLDPADGYTSEREGTFELDAAEASVGDIAFGVDSGLVVLWTADVSSQPRVALSTVDLSTSFTQELYRAPISSATVGFEPDPIPYLKALQVRPTGVLAFAYIGRSSRGIVTSNPRRTSSVVERVPSAVSQLSAQSPFSNELRFSTSVVDAHLAPEPILRDLRGRRMALGETRSLSGSRGAAQYTTEVPAGLPSGAYVLSVGGRSKLVVKQ